MGARGGGPPAILATGVTKRIGGRLVLSRVDLRVEKGASLTIFGPNGAGKSTLMRVLSTLVPPTSGTVEINGLRADDDSARLRRHIGVLSHQSYLYGSLTAYENLCFYGRMYGVERPQTRAKELLAEVGLELFTHDPVRSFSRGMQQRLAVARALIHEPSILLLDEPYTGLDRDAAAALTGILRRLKEAGRTMVVVSHDFEEGLSLGDDVVILSRGEIVWMGRARQLTPESMAREYERYAAGGSRPWGLVRRSAR